MKTISDFGFRISDWLRNKQIKTRNSKFKTLNSELETLNTKL
jgi:hypothetical protein